MEQEIKRLTELLSTLNPLSTDYTRALKNLSILYTLKEQTRIPYTQEYEEPIKATEPTPMAEPISTTVVAEAKPVVTAESKTTYDKLEVRTLLSTASSNGVLIEPIISKYVPEGKPVKFSEIPASCYPDLVKELQNAK